MKTNRAATLAFLLVSATVFEGLLCPGLTAAAQDPAAVIDKNQFKNDSDEKKTDFHLNIKGTFTEPPKSDKFPNVTSPDGKPLKGNRNADFSGGTVNPGESLTVTFKSTASKNAPLGDFTPGGPNFVKSIAPNGEEVSFAPAGGDQFLCSLSLANVDFASLTGDLTVYVNSGISHFTLDEFDTLFSAVTVRSLPDYSFDLNEGVSDITASMSIDQYLLVVGTADTGDGSGPHPFALAYAPPGSVPGIPDPGSTFVLQSIGVLGLFMFGWRGRRHGVRGVADC